MAAGGVAGVLGAVGVEGVAVKIKQQPKFQPITITLETTEEAEAFWNALRSAETVVVDDSARRIVLDLQNWFSSVSQLGGE